jgi:hypothetical protein
MPKQSVTAKMDVETQLRNEGVTLEYYQDDQFIGYLNIGKAKLQWKKRDAKKPTGQKSWEELIAWITS